MTDITEVIGVCEWVAKRTTDFSAKVYKDGDRVYAVDSDGKTIAEGEAGVDDASVIQSALYFIKDKHSRGLLFITNGEYDLKGNVIQLTDVRDISAINNLKIKGAGIDKTVIKNGGFRKPTTSSTNVAEEEENNPQAYNVEIEDMTIDVNNTADINAINLTGYSYNYKLRRLKLMNTNNRFLLEWHDVDNLLVEDVIFYNAGLGGNYDMAAGNQLYDSEGRTVFRNCWFIQDEGNIGGMLTTGGTGNLLIDGCTFIDNTDARYAAISIENTFGAVKDIQVVNCRAYGAHAEIDIGNGTDNQIEKGTIYGCISTGRQRIMNAKEAIISDSIIFNSVYGFHLRDNHVAKLINCIVKNTDYYRSGTYTSLKGGVYIDNNDYVEIIGLHVYDDQATPSTTYGLYGSSEYIFISNSIFEGGFTKEAVALGSGSVLKWTGGKVNGSVFSGTFTAEKTIKYVSGYQTHNSGTATFSGDGSTTQFSITHCLVSTPTKVQVTAMSEDASGDFYVTADATYIYVNYKTAPPSGTDNIKLSWYAEV
mgnify:CR=1 FL=1